MPLVFPSRPNLELCIFHAGSCGVGPSNLKIGLLRSVRQLVRRVITLGVVVLVFDLSLVLLAVLTNLRRYVVRFVVWHWLPGRVLHLVR